MFPDHLLLPFDPLRAAASDYLGAFWDAGKVPKTFCRYGDVLERFRAFAAPVDLAEERGIDSAGRAKCFASRP